MKDKEVDVNELGAIYSEEHKEIEDNAVDKFEKGQNGYHKKERINWVPLSCQKCGSNKTLMKIKSNGQEFWFCQKCVRERANELLKEENENSGKIIGEL